ncbi:MAG TPA: phenylalanine--tRNA ligase subunit beta [Propionibacteriaceae bacterium]|nr:phenylalanine--tRNA ligase subunit beta [Propionibacteriaceae bacterium]
MRAPVSWVREYVALPDEVTGRDIGDALIRAGLEVEAVEPATEITGPLVVGRVLSCVDEPQKNGKTIRWCRVDVGPYNEGASEPDETGGSRGIVCGAHNFVAGDLVVVALPGTVLPGGFELTARKTYGHVSDGMICAVDELGIGTDHTGILVLPAGSAEPGDDALALLGLTDEVLDIAVTADMGYCLSVRGLARETAQAFGVPFTDPVSVPTPSPKADGFPVRSETEHCPLFVAVSVTGVDPSRPSPDWMASRLRLSGMRSVSLSVDITNYVMLETGQPLHAYDADRLSGGIVVREAKPGERLTTLDDVDRLLDPEDLVITDDSGVIGLAGVMGGQTTELSETTTNILIEAASFAPVQISRTARRHKLPSEASRRFERWVDPNAAYSAAHRVADLLVELAGGTVVEAETVYGRVPAMPSQTIRGTLPAEVLGAPVSVDRVVSILRGSGVEVTQEDDRLTLVPPTWRPDLVDAYDYVEEVGNKVGLDTIEPVLPRPTGGRGLTARQKARRALSAALPAVGFVEVIQFPFLAEADIDRLGADAEDERRKLVRLANPLAETSPYLRTTLLPGLFGAVLRNQSRGQTDLALYEVGSVFMGPLGVAPMPSVEARPSDEDLAAIAAALPKQPTHVACVLTGEWLPASAGRPAVLAGWEQAIAFAETVGRALGVRLERTANAYPPYHPGRCARLMVGDVTVGHAGELHPDVCRVYGLPARTAAAELSFDALCELFPGPGSVAPVSSWPVAKEDVALIVDASVQAGDVEAALREGAGDLLEDVRLFDVYSSDAIGAGKKSLAFALRLRAPDRTLTEADAAAARDAAVAVAAERYGAVQRIA